MKKYIKVFSTKIEKIAVNEEDLAYGVIGKKVSCSKDAANLFHAMYSNKLFIEESEAFCVAFLNNATKVIALEVVGTGSISATVVNKQKIARRALEHNAKSVILCHNHPSGTMSPSKPDISITQEIKRGLAFLDISVLDHVIIGVNEFDIPVHYSFADEGNL